MLKIWKVWPVAVAASMLAAGPSLAEPTKGTDPFKPTVPVKLSAADLRAVQTGVRRGLKDPDSAKFGQFAAGSDETKLVNVCGHVNARNSYGGYTGPVPFMGILAQSKFVVLSMGSDQDMATVVLRSCKKMGLDLAALAHQ